MRPAARIAARLRGVGGARAAHAADLHPGLLPGAARRHGRRPRGAAAGGGGHLPGVDPAAAAWWTRSSRSPATTPASSSPPWRRVSVDALVGEEVDRLVQAGLADPGRISVTQRAGRAAGHRRRHAAPGRRQPAAERGAVRGRRPMWASASWRQRAGAAARGGQRGRTAHRRREQGRIFRRFYRGRAARRPRAWAWGSLWCGRSARCSVGGRNWSRAGRLDPLQGDYPFGPGHSSPHGAARLARAVRGRVLPYMPRLCQSTARWACESPSSNLPLQVSTYIAS